MVKNAVISLIFFIEIECIILFYFVLFYYCK